MHRVRNGRARVAVAIQPAVRAAIYTRKSTDEGLDRGFNSLDNQRERAEAYAASQEGWSVLADRYDDGGFSGGNTERPALKRLLADAKAERFDAVIVYRLDRISRSLRDFLGIHEFFEQHGIALISVTESINTQTPHGRMMVNVLLSFAQYERELAAERTRHKIHGARRRGKWTGGTPPLGYDVAPEGGRLVVNKDEAERVRAIFEQYADTPSLVKVSQELNRRGWRTKSWTTREGKHHPGNPWNRVSLARLLANPVVVGRIGLGDETFRADHDAIVPKALFERVQTLMKQNRATGGSGARNRHGALLRGLLRCSACGMAMTHSPVRRGAKLHRYYRCVAAQKNGHDACPTKAVVADKVEAFVVDQIRRIGANPALQQATFEQAVSQVKAQRRGLKAEAKRIHRELPAVRSDVERLVGAVSRTGGSAANAIAAELARAQERLATLEQRLAEVQTEETALSKQTVDPADMAKALTEFDPIWDVLLQPERERVLRLLIEKLDYDGRQLKIQWRLAGFSELAAEVAP